MVRSNNNNVFALVIAGALVLAGVKVNRVVGAASSTEEYDDYVSYVSTLVGTRSRYDLGRGSTLPFVGRPWGMNNWSPQTNDKEGSYLGLHKWWFHPDDAFFYGFRCTHQASPWIYDYGQFLLTPAMGLEQSGWPNEASSWNKTSSSFGPHEVNISLSNYCTAKGECMTTAITATERAAIMRVEFPPHDDSNNADESKRLRILLGQSGGGLTDSITINETDNTFYGWTRANSGGVPTSLQDAEEEHLQRLGFYERSVSASAFRMSLSISLRSGSITVGEEVHDLTIREFSMKNSRSDPGEVCAGACASANGCKAFSVSMRNAGTSEDDTCTLLRAAILDKKRPAAGLVGWATSSSPQILTVHFAHYFVGEIVGANIANSNVATIANDGMYMGALSSVMRFDSSAREINVRIGTSFISIEQAWKNLKRELPPSSSNLAADYAAAQLSTRKSWNDLLEKTQLVSSGRDGQYDTDAKRTWYSNWYRASIYPRMLFEMDDNGDPMHYSPYDSQGRTFPGPLSSDAGFWDIYRTVYPLQSVVSPNRTKLQFEGWWVSDISFLFFI